MLRFILTAGAVFLCVQISLCQQPVTFSVQAHEDDWQLFMSNAVINDITASKKVVFITLTAGDAGNGTAMYGSTIPFYIAREKGSLQSSKFTADLSGTQPQALSAASVVSVNGHAITKYVYKNTVNYFLRLPDGGGAGAGSQYTGFQSLQRLKTGAITTISAIDGSASYNGWNDLLQTLLQIVLLEKSSGQPSWVYTTSIATANANDHSDHIYSGMAIQEAVANYLWVGINEFIGYASGGQPQNLTTSQLADATGAFASYVWGMNASQYVGNFDVGHLSWLPADLAAIKRNPVGITPAAQPVFENNEPAITTFSINYLPGEENASIVITPKETGNMMLELLNSKNEKLVTNNFLATAQKVLPVNKTLLTEDMFLLNITLNGHQFQHRLINIQ